jgi:hypothetical protein
MLSLSCLCERLLQCFRVLWTIFFTDLSEGTGAPASTLSDDAVSAEGLRIYASFLEEAKWSLSLTKPYEDECFANVMWDTWDLAITMNPEDSHLVTRRRTPAASATI